MTGKNGLLAFVGGVAIMALIGAIDVRSATAQTTVPLRTAVYSTADAGVQVTPVQWGYRGRVYGRPYGYRGYYRGPYVYRGWYAPRYYSYYPYPYVVPPYSTYYYPGYTYPSGVYLSTPTIRGYVPLGQYYW